MAAYCSTAHAASLLSILFLCCCALSIARPHASGGFTVELIHRDSEKSPFFNPLETSYQRLISSLRRSIPHANRFRAKSSAVPNTAESTLTSVIGEYIMKYSIGTPPFEIHGIVDTGSDLIWSQCMPCLDCYKQTPPMFNPARSKTYSKVPCQSAACESLQSDADCSRGEHSCTYSVRYGDRSYTYGDVALETMTLDSTDGRPVSFPKTIIGCGHENGGKFGPQGSGIVGLGRGEVSLISQLHSSADGKFSYCLVPAYSTNSSSQLNFGKNAIVSGHGTVTTPMISSSTNNFYHLTLEDITVGTKRLNLNVKGSSSNVQQGNIIIDSGTTMTLLPSDVYTQLESAVAQQIRAKRVNDPSQTLSLCYQSISDEFDAPVITVHFTGGDVQLKPLNTFVRIAEDVVCFSFGSSDSISIFGNLAQMNFLVGYDLEKSTVSFKSTDCTRSSRMF